MKIEIENLTNVTVDGESRGGVVDVLFHAASTGDESIRAPLLDALLARETQIVQDAVETERQRGADELSRANAANEAAATAAQVAATQARNDLELKLNLEWTNRLTAANAEKDELTRLLAEERTLHSATGAKLSAATTALNENSARQATLAQRAVALRDKLTAGFGELSALVDDAGKTNADKKIEEAKKQLADAKAAVARLEGRIEPA